MDISYFLKRNRIEYYERLTEVREKGNFEQWVKFFLQGIYEAAEDSIETIDALADLHNKYLAAITAVDARTGILKKLFAYLEQTPIVDIKKTATALGISYNTASTAVKKMMEVGVLVQVDNSRRERSFAYEEYLAILRKDT